MSDNDTINDDSASASANGGSDSHSSESSHHASASGRPAMEQHLDVTAEANEPEFMCKCQHNKGTPCCTAFHPEALQMMRLGYLELSRDELDIAVLSKLSSGMHLTASTAKSRKREQFERKAQRTDFFLHGFRICRDTFKLGLQINLVN